MIQNRRLSAILSLFMFLLVVLGGGMEGFVVCITPGGQLALEHMSGECCDDNTKPAVGASLGLSFTGSSRADYHHCDSCVDVALFSSGAIRQPSSDASGKLRAVDIAVAPFMAAKYRSMAKEGRTSLPPPVVSTTLASLRSVSLLI